MQKKTSDKVYAHGRLARSAIFDDGQQTKVSAFGPALVPRYRVNWKRTLARNGLATPDMIEVTTAIVPRMACCPYAEVANGSSGGAAGVKLCVTWIERRGGRKIQETHRHRSCWSSGNSCNRSMRSSCDGWMVKKERQLGIALHSSIEGWMTNR
jgi:hypothetical protein